MAIYTKTVDPNGGADYTSLSAWEAGEAGKYTSGDTALAECRRTGAARDTTPFVIGGWNSGVLPKITVHPDYRHEGKFANQRGDGKYVYTFAPTTDAVGIAVYNSNVTIEWLQIEHLGSGLANNDDVALAPGYYGLKLLQCLFKCSNTSGSDYFSAIYLASTVTTAYSFVINCCIIGYRRSDTTVRGITIGGTPTAIYCTTIYNADLGIYRIYGTTYVQNTIVCNCYSSCYGGTFTNSGWNVSSDATAPGTPVAINKTDYSTYFKDVANYDFHLKDTAYNLFGINGNTGLSSSTTIDIDNQTRVAYDIGADEYIVPNLNVSVALQTLSLSQAGAALQISASTPVGVQSLQLSQNPVTVTALPVLVVPTEHQLLTLAQNPTVVTSSPVVPANAQSLLLAQTPVTFSITNAPVLVNSQQLTLTSQPCSVLVPLQVIPVGAQALNLQNYSVTTRSFAPNIYGVNFVAKSRRIICVLNGQEYTLVATPHGFSFVASDKLHTIEAYPRTHKFSS